MSDIRLDKIESLISDINTEATAIADAIDSESASAGTLITNLQGVGAAVSDPAASAKIDEIISALQQTKQNLGGLSDRVKAIIPDPAAVAPTPGTKQQSSGGQSTTGNTQNATTGQPVTTEEQSVAPTGS